MSNHPSREKVQHQVPFLTNAHLDCGPVSLAMVCSHFGLNIPMERIKELVSSETSGVTWTLGIAAAAAELGLSVKMYTKSIGVNPANFQLGYYQEHGSNLSDAQQKLTLLGKRILEGGGLLEERGVTIDELCQEVRSGSIPILLLDWGKVIGKPTYIGHFVPMVGYEGSQIVVHNPGPLDPTPFMRMERALVEVARCAPGTDEDVVIIGKSQR